MSLGLGHQGFKVICWKKKKTPSNLIYWLFFSYARQVQGVLCPAVQAGCLAGVTGQGVDADPWLLTLQAPETPRAPGARLPWPGGFFGPLWKPKAMGLQGFSYLNFVLNPPSVTRKEGL